MKQRQSLWIQGYFVYLATVEITSFRSIKSLVVEFQPGLNVLVGRNNVGKTNLLCAIRHALGPSASRGDSLWLDQDDFHRESMSKDHDTNISIVLTFKGLNESQQAHFFEIIDFDLASPASSKAIIRFDASWPKGKTHASVKRTGGPLVVEPTEIPQRILESIPVTFLPALRDAEAALAPGNRSRLALLLRDIASRKDSKSKDRIVDIFKKANIDLENVDLITNVAKSLLATTHSIAGSDHAPSTISAAEPEFEKILRTLQVQLKSVPIGSLSSNGLGLNNLLFMSVVLEHLRLDHPEESPILLVEEPEAHLHPQLTVLLAEFLSTKTPGKTAPQTFVSTHSPTLVAAVRPEQIQVMFSDLKTNQICCKGIASAGMTDNEQRELQRMMDVTRATLYFAKGAILVEGISESLLIPQLAKLLGHDLSQLHISVINICGVAFETFKKLLSSEVFGIPVSIVSDADPPVSPGTDWESDMPQLAEDGSRYKLCDRAIKLKSLFETHSTVKVLCSKLTLEYDLAEADPANALTMATVWESCFEGTPRTLNKSKVESAGTDATARALTVWRGICRSSHSGSKAELAHKLSDVFYRSQLDGVSSIFTVPAYIREAIEHVVTSVKATTIPITLISSS